MIMICLDRKICPLCKLSLVNKIRFGGLSLQRKLNLPVSKMKELISEVKKLGENFETIKTWQGKSSVI